MARTDAAVRVGVGRRDCSNRMPSKTIHVSLWLKLSQLTPHEGVQSLSPAGCLRRCPDAAQESESESPPQPATLFATTRARLGCVGAARSAERPRRGNAPAAPHGVASPMASAMEESGGPQPEHEEITQPDVLVAPKPRTL